MKVQKLNQRQAQWMLYLSRFDFTLKHVPGVRMEKADGLSRRLDWKVGVEKDNEDQVVIKDNWICKLQKVVIERPEVELLEKIKKARSRNKDIIRIVEKMKKTKIKKLQGNEWKIKEKLVLKEEKVYVPKDEKLRAEVIQLHHDVPAAGHGGRWKTVELVMRNYWQPGVTRDMRRYVEGCDLCQRMKNRTEELAGKLKLSEVPEKPWTYLMVDFITKLPVVAGKNAILVVCNRLSKMTYFIAMIEGILAAEEVVSTNTVKLRLPTLIRIHLVVNISQIVRYKEQVEGQKKEEEKPIEVEGVEEQEVEKILNKRKITGIEIYLVCWKGFTVEHDIWERREDLRNTKKVLEEFKGRMEAEVRKQEKIDRVEK